MPTAEEFEGKAKDQGMSPWNYARSLLEEPVKEFVEELAEWGVDGCAKIDFDDPELDVDKLDAFIHAENGYVREVA